MNQPLTKRFADWALDIGINDIPSEVTNAAKYAIFDTTGVMSAGVAHQSTRCLENLLISDSENCLIVSGTFGPPTVAALINGTAAHAWDFDDTSYTGIMHGSAVIFPAVLAVAQELGKDEEELITAFIVGSEVTYVLADICTHDHYFSGWFSSATFSLIGATVACAKLYGLDGTQTAQATGLAAAAAGGCRCLFGTDAKPYLIGEAAKRSIEMVLAIKSGLTGPVDAFENTNGFFAQLNQGISEVSEADSLGERWRLVEPGLLFKTSPVCSAAHAAIDQLSQLLLQTGAKADDIANIDVAVPELVDISLVYDWPANPQQAQFSLPYALACAALHGRVRLQDLTQEEINSPTQFELMEKVRSTVDADLSTKKMRARYPESARIKLTLKDGQIAEGFCGSACGMPDNPLTAADMSGKFAECVRFGGDRDIEASPNDYNIFDLVNQCFTHELML